MRSLAALVLFVLVLVPTNIITPPRVEGRILASPSQITTTTPLPGVHGHKHGALWDVTTSASITSGVVTFTPSSDGYHVHVSVSFDGSYPLGTILWSSTSYYYEVEVKRKGFLWDDKLYSSQFTVNPTTCCGLVISDLSFPNLDVDLTGFSINGDGQYYLRVRALNCCANGFLNPYIFWTDWSTSATVSLSLAQQQPQCPDNQTWNGQQCVPNQPPQPQTASISVYAEPHDIAGHDPTPANDLHAWMWVDYLLNGQPQEAANQQTPIVLNAADIGSQITVRLTAEPDNWKFACLWDNYGVAGYPISQCAWTLVIQVPNRQYTKIAAFFDYVTPSPQCTGGQVWNGNQCVCPSGQQWNGNQCITPPPPSPTCSGGQIWNGQECVCPSGQQWNGQQCVTPPPPSNGPCSSSPGLTQVSVWGLPSNYLGQDPAGLSNYDVHASIFMNHCWNGQLYQDAHVTPFIIDVDIGSTITFSVQSPSGFSCTWDHYGHQQHPNTCILQIQVTGNDKIAAFFQLPNATLVIDATSAMTQMTVKDQFPSVSNRAIANPT